MRLVPRFRHPSLGAEGAALPGGAACGGVRAALPHPASAVLSLSSCVLAWSGGAPVVRAAPEMHAAMLAPHGPTAAAAPLSRCRATACLRASAQQAFAPHGHRRLPPRVLPKKGQSVIGRAAARARTPQPPAAALGVAPSRSRGGFCGAAPRRAAPPPPAALGLAEAAGVHAPLWTALVSGYAALRAVETAILERALTAGIALLNLVHTLAYE